MKAALFLNLLVAMTGIVLMGADAVKAPLPQPAWATTSKHGHVVFKMVPGMAEGGTPRRHRASASVMGWDGSFEELWSVEGWYAQEGFLSENGRYFVRIGPGAGDAPEDPEALITFYDRGRLLRQHALKDLVKDAARAVPDRWRPQSQIEPNGFQDRAFHLVLNEDMVLMFDPVTGRLVGTRADVNRQRMSDLEDARENALHLKGEAAYAASSFKKDYEEHFDVGFIQADDLFKTPDVWFEGPEWRVTFKPKKMYPGILQVEVRAVFPWSEAGGIKGSVTADEIEAALQAAMAHPVIAGLNKADKIHIFELHITGDRLFANTSGLQEAMATLKLNAPAGIATAWAEIHLEYGRDDRDMFLNTQTGELIELHLPKPPTLYDAKGQEVKP